MAGFKGYKRSIVLDFDYNEVKKGVPEVNRQMALLNAEYKKAASSMDENSTKIDKLTLKREKLTHQMVAEANKVGLLKNELASLQTEEVANEKAIDRKTIALKNAEAQLNKTKAEVKSVNDELVKQQGALGKTTEEWDNIAKKTGDVGKSLTKNLTLPLAAIGAASVKAAVDFDTAFVGVEKTVDGTSEQMLKLKNAIREMSKEIPASAVEIANVAEVAGQLGIQIENIEEFTRVMIDLGESTNITATEGAAEMAKFANIMKTSTDDFDRLGSTIVSLGNNFATTEADILHMATRLAGAGAQVGMSEAQLISFATALSSVGIEADAGGTAFSKVMIEMQLAVETGGGMLEDFADVAGMSVGKFQQSFQKDAAGAVIAFIEGLGKMEKRGMSTIQVLDNMGIKEVRLRDSLLRASSASDKFTSAIEMGSKAWEENTALTDEAATRYASAESQFILLKDNFVDLGISIGEILLPVLLSVVKFTNDVVAAFSAIPEPLMKVIALVATIVAIIGPILLVISTVASAINGIGTAMKAVNDIGTLFSSAAGNSVYMTFVKWAAIIIAVVAAVTALLVVLNYLTGHGQEINAGISEISSAMGNTQSTLNNQIQNTGRRSYAIGTQYHPGGRVLVGEYGPEEVILPVGSKVRTASETAQNNKGGDTYNLNNVTIQTNDPQDLFNQIQILARKGVLV